MAKKTKSTGGIDKLLKGKTVLVTGGTGSIGGEIVRQLLRLPVRSVRIFSRDEAKQFAMQSELAGDVKARWLLGDVRDKDRLAMAMKNCDVAFHAAALKQVPTCEYNPFEAIKTNVIGTQNVIDAALETGVERVVAISTDKAVNPINTMGATKLLAEKLLIDANFYRGDLDSTFCAVRFGNVLGSRGSVVPAFRDMIARGGPVLITDPEMTRFMMPIADAVRLTLQAALRSRGGEIFILKMPAIRLEDLARVMIDELAGRCGHDPKKIGIKHIGARPGEKKHEGLMTEEEMINAREVKDMYVIYPDIEIPNFRMSAEKLGKTIADPDSLYSSQKVRCLTRKEIADLLKTHGIV